MRHKPFKPRDYVWPRRFPLSKTMQWSHMWMNIARGTRHRTWLPNVKATLADPRVPLKVKIWRARAYAPKAIR